MCDNSTEWKLKPGVGGRGFKLRQEWRKIKEVGKKRKTMIDSLRQNLLVCSEIWRRGSRGISK